jgi:hypothetical protein
MTMRHSFEYIQWGMHDESNLQMSMDLDFAFNVALNFEQNFRVFPCVYSQKKASFRSGLLIIQLT